MIVAPSLSIVVVERIVCRQQSIAPLCINTNNDI